MGTALKEDRSAAAEEAASRCGRCGREGRLDRDLQRVRRSFGIRRVLCVECLEKIQRRDARFAHMIEIIMPLCFAVVGTYLVVATPNPDVGWVFLNIALFFLCIWLLIVPHEIGHALAGMLVGFRIFEVSFGVGRTIWRHVRGELTVHWRAVPLLGYVLAATPVRRFYRTRSALFVLGGLAVNAGLLALFLPSALPLSALEERAEAGFALTPVLAAANAWLLGVNLLPWKMKPGSTVIPSDGLMLMSLLFLKRAAIEECVQQYPVIRWAMMRQSRGREQASRWLRETLSGQPLSNIMQSNIGIAWLDVGEFDRARELFLQCLQADEPPSQWRWLFLNNLAYADLLLEDASLLPEADRVSEEAFALAPAEPHVMSTRGSVLVHLERIEEGVALLEQAYAQLPDAVEKASTACSLAHAFLKKGERQRAHALLVAAERLDPSCLQLDRLHHAFAQHA